MSYPPQGGYPPPGYPYPYPPPPRRDNGRAVAGAIAAVVLLAACGGVYYAFQAASKTAAVQQQAQRIADIYAKAAQFYQAGRFAEAVPLFQKIREDTTASVDMVTKAAAGEAFCCRALGQKAQEINDLDTAEQWFLRAVRVNPDDPSAKSELEAVQRAKAILRGNAAPPTSGSPQTSVGGSNPMPGFDPSKEESADAKKVREAAERLDRGNTLFQQGNLSGACREWHEAFLTAPGSPAGIQASSLRRQHCPTFM